MQIVAFGGSNMIYVLALLALASCGRAQDAAADQADDEQEAQPVTMAAAPDSETMFIPFNNNAMMQLQKGSDKQAESGVVMTAFGAPAGAPAADGPVQPFMALGKPLRRGNGQNMRGQGQPSGDMQPAGGQNFGPGSQNFGPGMQNFGGAGQNFGGDAQNGGAGGQNFGGASQNSGGGKPNFGGANQNSGAGMQNFGSGAQNFGAAGGQNFGSGMQPMGADDSDGNQQPPKGRRRKLRVKKRRSTTPKSYVDANADLKALLLEKEEIERKATPKYKKAPNGRYSDGQQ